MEVLGRLLVMGFIFTYTGGSEVYHLAGEQAQGHPYLGFLAGAGVLPWGRYFLSSAICGPLCKTSPKIDQQGVTSF